MCAEKHMAQPKACQKPVEMDGITEQFPASHGGERHTMHTNYQTTLEQVWVLLSGYGLRYMHSDVASRRPFPVKGIRGLCAWGVEKGGGGVT